MEARPGPLSQSSLLLTLKLLLKLLNLLRHELEDVLKLMELLRNYLEQLLKLLKHLQLLQLEIVQLLQLLRHDLQQLLGHLLLPRRHADSWRAVRRRSPSSLRVADRRSECRERSCH